ncbi:hypothetical protein CRYPA_322 [uncultured Candidatus Thioglobus sp.]|nr:hypothetical protein CRYPA_322 [uncultured Candidatus Thioglobus sp.]
MSILDIAKASIISPAHGAQQECINSFFSPFGVVNTGRSYPDKL